jgi:endo-alpha-1,4-polygalactosaminidase (GH114 family)
MNQKGKKKQMSSSNDFEKRKKILEELKKFTRAEQEELYVILKKNGEEVSENRNGMFFDLLNLKDTTIDKINTLITFCNENRNSFESREKALLNLTAELESGTVEVE